MKKINIYQLIILPITALLFILFVAIVMNTPNSVDNKSIEYNNVLVKALKNK